MCREILTTGKVTMKGLVDETGKDTIDEVIDYSLSNKAVLVDAAKWDQATSKKYENLKTWRKSVIQKSGRAPNVCIMASDVVELFVTDADIQKRFNMFNMKFGNIQPKIVDDAVTYIGTLSELGLEIYSYDEWFLDDDGVEQPMMPAKTVILARIGMAKRIYGAVTQMDNAGNFITIEGTRVPKVWADLGNEVKLVKISSRPLPVPEDIDDWYVATVY
jgi:hypothetical protein